jgi:hypothetical protein
MVKMLNVGYEKGKKLYYPQHQMFITMPEPGAAFDVPAEVAGFLMSMPARMKVQRVTGAVPSNFTPPPGYKLVPVELPDEDPVDSVPVEKSAPKTKGKDKE